MLSFFVKYLLNLHSWSKVVLGSLAGSCTVCLVVFATRCKLLKIQYCYFKVMEITLLARLLAVRLLVSKLTTVLQIAKQS